MDVIFLASHEYEGSFKFRPQKLVEQFVKQGKVLYVEPTRTYRSWQPWTWGLLRYPEENLYVYTPQFS